MRKSFLLIFLVIFSGSLISLPFVSGDLAEYFLSIDESVTVEGKLVTLKNVTSTESVIIEIDGSAYTITGSETHDDLTITVVNVNYYYASPHFRWAWLDIDPATPTNNTCEDSDGGVDYYTKGCVTVCTHSEQDVDCETTCDSCSGELYCAGSYNKSTQLLCSYGCEDGACKNVCYGDMVLELKDLYTLYPNHVAVSSDVGMTAFGIHFCLPNSFVFRKNSCYGSDVCDVTCGYVSEGNELLCSCIFTSPNTLGDYTYFACFDKNMDGDYDDSGEYNSEVLTVTKTTTIPTTISPTTTAPQTTSIVSLTTAITTSIVTSTTTFTTTTSPITTTQKITEEPKKPNIFIRIYQRVLNVFMTLLGKWYKVFD